MKKKSLIIIMAAVLCLSFSACGSAKSSDIYYENYVDSSYQQNSISEDLAYSQTQSTENEQTTILPENRKLVYTANISLETLDFEKSQQALNDAVAACGGYVYSSELYGGNRYYQNSASVRNAYMTLKIPVDKYRDFLNGKDNFGNVTSFSEQTDDITSQYIDTESRLNALKEQEKRLLELVSKAENVKELLEIEQTLSEVRYEIENYTSQMQTYENMISYCTVNVSITEVSEISQIDKGFFSKFSEAFVSSWVELLNFVQHVAIWITARLSFILLIALIAFLVYKTAKKKKKNRVGKLPNFPNAITNQDENKGEQQQ